MKAPLGSAKTQFPVCNGLQLENSTYTCLKSTLFIKCREIGLLKCI